MLLMQQVLFFSLAYPVADFFWLPAGEKNTKKVQICLFLILSWAQSHVSIVCISVHWNSTEEQHSVFKAIFLQCLCLLISSPKPTADLWHQLINVWLGVNEEVKWRQSAKSKETDSNQQTLSKPNLEQASLSFVQQLLLTGIFAEPCRRSQ